MPAARRDDASDADLLLDARSGDPDAIETLHERHGDAALAVARQYAPSDDAAEALVVAALSDVDGVVRAGEGPEVAYRLYLFAAVRRLALAHRAADHLDPRSPLPAAAGAAGPAAAVLVDPADGPAAAAYASLPERWQAVLWYAEVERMPAEQTARLLGLSTGEATTLAYLAREGLRGALLSHHLEGAPTAQCGPVHEMLPAYMRGDLSRRDTVRVRAHLESCEHCRAARRGLEHSERDMRGIVAPLLIGAVGLGALADHLPVGALGSAAAAAGAAGAHGRHAADAAPAAAGDARPGGEGGVGVAAVDDGSAPEVDGGATGAGASGDQADTADQAGVGAVAGAGVGTAAAVAAGLAGAGIVGAGVAGPGAAPAAAGDVTGAADGSASAGAGAGAGPAGAGEPVGGAGEDPLWEEVLGAPAAAAAAAPASSVPVGVVAAAITAGVAAVSLVVAGVLDQDAEDGSAPVAAPESQAPLDGGDGDDLAEPTDPPLPEPPAVEQPAAQPEAEPLAPPEPEAVPAVVAGREDDGDDAVIRSALLGEPSTPVRPPFSAVSGPAVVPVVNSEPVVLPVQPAPPTTEPEPPVAEPSPASLDVSSPGTEVVLVPGQAQTLSIGILNIGDAAAADVRASFVLPPGLALDAAGPGGDGWAPCGDAADQLCLAELPAGSTSTMSVPIRIADPTAVEPRSVVAVTITAVGLDPVEVVVPVSVAPVGPEITLGMPDTVRLGVDQPQRVTFSVQNSAPTAARDVVASVSLPPGVRWSGAADEAAPWVCEPTGDVVSCSVAELPGAAGDVPAVLELSLTLVAAVGAVGVPAELGLNVVADGGRSSLTSRTTVEVGTSVPGEPPVPGVPPVPEVPEVPEVPVPTPEVPVPTPEVPTPEVPEVPVPVPVPVPTPEVPEVPEVPIPTPEVPDVPTPAPTTPEVRDLPVDPVPERTPTPAPLPDAPL